ncbi:carboxypeptidase regulatory-like domain-containing protein [Mitsuaria sp. WAJ17]|uniref:TonB-dependent receptor n=1 Tax=Mitsuaria sp. WAJ17 TaxID=2761452 RepID=UPI0015FF1C98|nr:carboxypeptidase regulatory-like domain-containing protein [Mitsuaria sp. WAJ17]MBB2483877.1 carboxypeptidase regulatory-like domain-containing protein [Mitsuaria sp. WAJ17]
MKLSTLRQSSLAAAISLMLASSAVYAQSNTVGTIYGQAANAKGSTLVVENAATGAKRTLTLDESGRFNVTALPAGTYKVTLLKDGAVVSTREGVEVRIGQGSELQFGTAQTLSTVEVTGKVARLDMANSNNGATFSAAQLDRLPVAKSIDGIIQLAPNTTKADSRYAGGASFGGGAASENAYYINGFPVTNPLTQLGSSELPFGAIANAQILTGGFGAEFGRSTGGVVNITTKSGGNIWEGGVNMSFTPSSLHGTRKDIFYPKTGKNTTDGSLFQSRRHNTEDEYSIGAYVGGPLIKDKLFMFTAVERLMRNTGQVTLTRDVDEKSDSGWTDARNVNNRYMSKFDWNVTDDHHLELTLLGDAYTRKERLGGWDYATDSRFGSLGDTSTFRDVANKTDGVGSTSQILKYTGSLTQDLTLTFLHGRSDSPHKQTLAGYDPKLPGVIASPVNRAPGITYNTTAQPFAGERLLAEGAKDKVKSTRLDIEWQHGKHTVRAGIDNNTLRSINAGESTAGGLTYTYFKSAASPDGTVPVTDLRSVGTITPAAGGQLGNQGYYVRATQFDDITNAESTQAAQYIEDKYQVTKDLLVTAGLRNETYENKNGDGQVFLKNKNLNPRLAFSLDPLSDKTTHVFGSVGRYAIQIPTHIAVRGASRSTYIDTYSTYSGVDAKGAPINPVLLATGSPDNEFGQAKLYQTVAAQDLKAAAQDEITLGIERTLTERLNVGAKLTYRKMISTIDDYCDQTPFNKYAEDHGIDASHWGGFTCASINPGRSNTFLVNYSGDGKTFVPVTLSAAEMGFADNPGQRKAPSRSYFALDFFAEHPFRDGWYGKINYTLSYNKGNTEGQTLSDVGQTDVSATQTWDHSGIMEHAYGYLPNDRRHQIKAFGFMELNDQWQVGGNVLLAAGRPTNCLGAYAGSNPTGDQGYGSSYHYCDGKPSPRGTFGHLSWDTRFDMNVVYRPATIKGLSLRVDVFNLLNRQVAQNVDETYLDGDAVSPTFGRTLSYTAPRSVKFTLSYDFK